MFCFKCGASMPDDSKVCPQCATPVADAPQAAPAPPPPSASPASTSPWLNVPPASAQYAPQAQPYAGQGRPYPQAPTDGKAIASLVLGIASLFLCLSIIAGIPAIILGHMSRTNIRRSMGRLKGDGMALAGLIMGYISIPWILIVAAIAIPNLMRSRMVANEAGAMSTVRTINTTQVTYSTQFPNRGYAPDLASLGPGPTGSCSGEGTAEHACLLDNVVANSSCTAGAWCTKSSYKFSMSAEGNCGGSGQAAGAECTYVVVATPVDSAAGRRSFCSTSDAVIRSRYAVLASPITAEQCNQWLPLAD
jgi:type IV pilus assembly protein PilA